MPEPLRPALVTISRLLATLAATLVAAACAAAQPMPAARAFGTLKANVSQVSNGNLTRELRIHWTAPRAGTQGASTNSPNSFKLLGQVRFSGAPRRERQPEPSANDLVIVLQDSSGNDLDWRIIPNPRLIRSETPDRSGLLSGQLIERDEVELLVYVPDLGQDGKPAIPGLPLADLLASLHGLAGVLMALLRRENTGKGDFIDIAMHDSMLAGMPNVLGPTFAENRQPVATHERSTGGSAFYRLYDTADGRHLALGGQEPKFVRNLLGALGRLDLAPLCEKPGPHQQPVMQFLESFFRGKTLQDALAFLSRLDVCYAPVSTLPEALDAAAEKLLKDELGRRHLAPPIRFRDEPARPSLREPRLGEHDALKKR